MRQWTTGESGLSFADACRINSLETDGGQGVFKQNATEGKKQAKERRSAMKGYVILLAAACLQFCLGGVYAFSTFMPYLEREFAIGAGRSQYIFGTTILVFTATMIVGGRLQHRHGPRRIALLGALCYGCAYLGVGLFAVDFLGFLMFKGVLEGVGIGLGYVCPLAVALKWFPRRKGLATGVVVGGFGAGAIALSAVAESMFGSGISLSRVFILLGFAYLCLSGLAAAMLSLPPEEVVPNGQVDLGEEISDWGVRRILGDRRFWVLTPAMFAGTFGGLLVIGSLRSIGEDGGLPEAQAVLAIGVFAVGNTLGRLIWGVLSDRFGRVTIPLSLLSMSVALFCLLPALGVSPGGFLAVVALVGFSFGACFVLYAAETAVFFSARVVGIVYPVIFFSGYGLPGIFGPGVGGWLRDATGGYLSPVLMAGLVALLGAGFAAVALFRLRLPGATTLSSKP